MNARLKPVVEIEREVYTDELIEEMRPLLFKHWKEIATYQDRIPLDPDFSLYAKLDAMGKLLCLTARLDGRLIGYSVFLLTRVAHYKSTLCAVNDVIYVEPEFRKGSIGVRLIRESEKRLKDLGVVKMTWHTKTSNDLSALLLKMGFAVDEIMMAKVL
jgi:GNAT superfamily N-acetyltransferase